MMPSAMWKDGLCVICGFSPEAHGLVNDHTYKELYDAGICPDCRNLFSTPVVACSHMHEPYDWGHDLAPMWDKIDKQDLLLSMTWNDQWREPMTLEQKPLPFVGTDMAKEGQDKTCCGEVRQTSLSILRYRAESHQTKARQLFALLSELEQRFPHGLPKDADDALWDLLVGRT
jgi:hypothetical protein